MREQGKNDHASIHILLGFELYFPLGLAPSRLLIEVFIDDQLIEEEALEASREVLTVFHCIFVAHVDALSGVALLADPSHFFFLEAAHFKDAKNHGSFDSGVHYWIYGAKNVGHLYLGQKGVFSKDIV